MLTIKVKTAPGATHPDWDAMEAALQWAKAYTWASPEPVDGEPDTWEVTIGLPVAHPTIEVPADAGVGDFSRAPWQLDFSQVEDPRRLG